MRIFTLFIAFLLCSRTISAQFETDYKPVVSRGNLPADFVTLSSQKYEAEKDSLKSEKRSERKKKEKQRADYEGDAYRLRRDGKLPSKRMSSLIVPTK